MPIPIAKKSAKSKLVGYNPVMIWHGMNDFTKVKFSLALPKIALFFASFEIFGPVKQLCYSTNQAACFDLRYKQQ